MKYPRLFSLLALAIAFAGLTSCATVSKIPLTLAYINDDLGGHSIAASVTMGGKAPKATLALTKRNSRLLADSGK